MTHVRILFYGKLADRIARSVDLDCSEASATIGTLRARLAKLYPEAGADLLGSGSRACVGDELVDDAHLVQASETIEFFPPVSGG